MVEGVRVSSFLLLTMFLLPCSMIDGNRSVSFLYVDGFRTSHLLLEPFALLLFVWNGEVSGFGAGDLREGLADFLVNAS